MRTSEGLNSSVLSFIGTNRYVFIQQCIKLSHFTSETAALVPRQIVYTGN